MEIKFKDQLSLGVASAATQIEGGKCEHNWNDWYIRGNIKDHSSPDRATDHYHLWKEEANLMAFMKIKHYRMGIEWARICPNEGEVDEAVIARYREELQYLKEQGITVLLTYKKNNINVDKRFDFNELMPEAIAYINHGGQNSIMTGLTYGVPQIMCPGNVFERIYNANSIVNLGAGVSLESSDFNVETIEKIVGDFNKNPMYRNNSKKAGERLLSLGGVNKVVEVIEDLI